MPNEPILIVDDVADNATLIELMLHESGFTNTHVVTEAPTVMDAAAELEPDLILLDLRMPVIDGFEILARLGRSEDLLHVPVLVMTGDASTDARNAALALGAKDFLTKPYDATEVVLRVKNLLETRALHKELQEQNQGLEQGVRARTRELWDAVQGIERTEQEVRRSREQTIVRLALAAEFKDDETPAHVERMSRYCELLADRAGYDKEAAGFIRLASALHDVGKIGLPDDILMASGKLTAKQRAIMQTHTEIGFSILTGSGTPLLDLAASIALTHHERLDGSGYPRGVRGGEIPIEGRIAAIADVFDALTTHRVYRRKLDLGAAVGLLLEGRGTQFDPDLLDLFLGSIDEVLKIKELNEDAA